MLSFDVAKVVISGSFSKDRHGLRDQYRELLETHCQVLSPRSIEFDSQAFVRSRTEKNMSIKSIQDNHLASIREADFVWLHCPGGYVGISGALEVGFAHAHNIPVFSLHTPIDTTLAEYIQVTTGVYAAKQKVKALSK